MFSDIHAIVRACGVCATRGRRPPKQAIQGHVRSDVPGEMWMLDVLHMPKSKYGSQYILTMIDVASRWVYLAPLEKIDSASIVRAVEHHIIGDGIFPKVLSRIMVVSLRRTLQISVQCIILRPRNRYPTMRKGMVS